MDRLLQDIRHGARRLLRAPGFSFVAILTLALGIGATTAIFSVLNAVVLEPLDYPESDRLVSIKHPVPGLNSDWEWGLSSGGYFHFTDNARTLEAVGLYALTEITLTGEGAAEELQAARVNAPLFRVLRARPLHGRAIAEQDSRSLTPASPIGVAVLGYDFWRNRFGGDPGVVGTSIRLEGAQVEIVGVAEPDVELPDESVDIWLPMYLDPAMYHANSHQFNAIARLADGTSIQQAQLELDRLTEQFAEAVPTAYAGSFMQESRFSTVVRPLRDEVVGDIDRVLWILLGAVAVVLLIACANAFNLFLVRVESQRREIAIRSAIGGGRLQLAGRYLAEGLLLALLACAAAIMLADAGVQLLLALSPADVPRLTEVALGWKSVVFAALISVVAGMTFGLLPLLRAEVSYDALRDGGRGLTASRGRNAVRRSLVVGQVALAFVLVAAAGLMLRTFHNIGAVDPGLDPERVLTIDISLPSADYETYDDVAAFYGELTRQVEAVPGVESAGAIAGLPLGGGYQYGCNLVFPEDWNARAERYPCVQTTYVAPGFFETMDIPVRGRESDWGENERHTAGAVVSQAFADRVWPGEDAIGKGITGYMSEQPHFRVVGIAGDVRAAGLDQPPVEMVYFPMIPVEGSRLWSPPRSMTLAVRSRTDQPELLAAAVRRSVIELDPAVPIGEIRTMERVIASSMARTSFAMLLLGIAAAVALLLGAVGLYGVLSYIVGQRRVEIGIRMALGAQASRVAGSIVQHTLATVVVGVAIGLVAALAVTRVLQNLLFGITPTDPATLIAVSILLLCVALFASYVPARRAARVNPIDALRAE